MIDPESAKLSAKEERFDVGHDLHVNVRLHTRPLEHDYTFSICTMLASDEKYRRSLKSFKEFGFTQQNTQFLAVDNRNGNHFDGYAWTRRMIPECKGKYIIFCHDDVELVDDNYDTLVGRLAALTAADPKWALAGNAGGLLGWTDEKKRRRLALRISDQSFSNKTFGTLPTRCESLDENFIVMRREHAVSGSSDLSGFHLYGTDLCLRAELAGYTTYVIDFHLFHHGNGTKGIPYREQKRKIENKYRKIFPNRCVSTSTEILRF